MSQDLKLYNSLSRKKEVFKPVNNDNVRLYACGPTVYSFTHIGNARMAVVFDVLARGGSTRITTGNCGCKDYGVGD